MKFVPLENLRFKGKVGKIQVITVVAVIYWYEKQLILPNRVFHLRKKSLQPKMVISLNKKQHAEHNRLKRSFVKVVENSNSRKECPNES